MKSAGPFWRRMPDSTSADPSADVSQFRSATLRRERSASVRVRMLVLTWLVGGTVFSTCQTQLRDAVVFGTKAYVLDVLLDPQTVIEILVGSDGEVGTTGSTP